MTNTCKVKHVFPGGNTTVGFYSFYDQILLQEQANHIYVLKGGPGVGKSSFMKKIGKKMTELDFFVEYHHCSSDPNSLDALVIPQLKVAFLDGTSPHVVDPINPGAVDEIINLGEYWNEEGIKKNKENVIQTNKEIGRLFNKAYQYLKSAKEIFDTYELTANKALNKSEYHKVKQNLVKTLFDKSVSNESIGSARHLFGYALTPIGITEYRDTIVCHCDKRYLIKETFGASSEELMNEILHIALNRGYNVECYHSPLKVSKIEDIVIPELNIAISVENDYQKIEFDYHHEIDLTQLLNQNMLNTLKEELKDDKDIFDMLLYKALNYINKAKSVHDELEKYYIPHMDFEQSELLIPIILDKILKYK